VKYWFTGDDHFNHSNIIKYCSRPFRNVDVMDNVLIKRWNERVKADDIVIHVGDFGFFRGHKNYQYYIGQLNGTKVILRGNHDNNNGVRTNIESIVMEYGGVDWWIQHRPVLKFKHNICGHVHDHWKVWKSHDKVCVNVGVDVWDYRPVDIQEIMKAISEVKEDGYSGGSDIPDSAA